MPLTEAERTSVYKHLKYTVLTTPTTLSLGSPQVTQAKFVLDQNLLNITPAGEASIRETLAKLDCFERKIDEIIEGVDVAGMGTIRFRQGDALLDIEDVYRRYQLR